VRESGCFEISLNVLLVGLYRGSSEEVADLLGARAQRLGSVTKSDDTLFEGGSDQHEHAPGEAPKRMHVEISHIRWIDRVAERLRETARRHLGERVECGAVDEALLK
jgi:hypothetical protein